MKSKDVIRMGCLPEWAETHASGLVVAGWLDVAIMAIA